MKISAIIPCIIVIWLVGCAAILVFGGQANKQKDLFEAVYKDDLAMAELLLRSGADTDAFNKDRSPLIACARSAKMTEVLMAHGAKLQGSKPRPYSLLWDAAGAGDMARVKYLVAKGADLTATAGSDFQTTPFCQAMRAGHYDIAMYLLDVQLDTIKWDQILSGMVPCLEEDDVRTIRLITEKAAGALAHTNWQNQLLLVAARYGSQRVATFCIDSGADPNMADERGDTPLMAAIHSCYEYPPARDELVRLLLERGASASRVYSNGKTALHEIADCTGKEQMLKLFADHGAKVDTQDAHGDTPLHIAASYGRADMVSALLSLRASASIKNDRGETPYALAKQRSQKEVLDILEKAGIHE